MVMEHSRLRSPVEAVLAPYGVVAGPGSYALRVPRFLDSPLNSEQVLLAATMQVAVVFVGVSGSGRAWSILGCGPTANRHCPDGNASPLIQRDKRQR
jgi:hypothetical protein